MQKLKLKDLLLTGVAFGGLLIGSAQPVAASIKGSLPPHGAEREYSTVSVHGNTLMTVSGTFAEGPLASHFTTC